MFYVIGAYLCVATFLMGVATTVVVSDGLQMSAERALKIIGMALIWPWYFCLFLLTVALNFIFGERK